MCPVVKPRGEELISDNVVDVKGETLIVIQ